MTNFLKPSVTTGLPTGTAIAPSDLPTITLTNDITGSAAGGTISTTIANNAVTNAKSAQMAASTIKGNNTAAPANPLDLSVAQVQAMLSVPTASAPLPIGAGGTGQITQQSALDALSGTQSAGKYLRSDGTHTSLSNIQAGDIPSLSATYVTIASGNMAGGYAVLDVSGKVAAAQLPSTLLEYQGLWDPSTNTPFLQDAAYSFIVTSANATVGATYTNNGQTFTVITTIVGGTLLGCSGTGAPSVSGVLIKTGGTGDATITFSSVNTPTNAFVYQVSVNHAAVISGLSDPTMVNFLVGNLIIYSASVGKWEQTTPAAGVSSVNGAQGAVTVNAINQLTNDVTTAAAVGSQSLAATIANNAVTNAKAAQMGAYTIKGNNTGSTANASDLTQAQVTAMLNQFSSSLQGVVPASSGGTVNFLRADGTWAAPPAGFTNPMTTLGDIIYENSTPAAARLAGNTTTTKMFLTQTGTGSISAIPAWATISAGDVPTLNQATTASAGSISGTNVITNTNLSQMGANTIKGNNSGGTANASDLTAAQVTAMLNQFTSLLQGLVPSSGGGSTNYLRADGTWAAPSSSFTTYRAGKTAIGGSATSLAVTFSSAMANTNYAVQAQMVNTTDANPQFQPLVITAYSTTGFTVQWDAPTATANYSIMYTAMPNN